jgi:hypothetical protein
MASFRTAGSSVEGPGHCRSQKEPSYRCLARDATPKLLNPTLGVEVVLIEWVIQRSDPRWRIERDLLLDRDYVCGIGVVSPVPVPVWGLVQ